MVLKRSIQNTGAAGNHLCLSPDPLWASYSNKVDSGAYMYLAYETSQKRENQVPTS